MNAAARLRDRIGRFRRHAHTSSEVTLDSAPVPDDGPSDADLYDPSAFAGPPAIPPEKPWFSNQDGLETSWRPAQRTNDVSLIRAWATNANAHRYLVLNPATPADVLRHIWMRGDGPDIRVLAHQNTPIRLIADARHSSDQTIALHAKHEYRRRLGLPHTQ